MIHDSASSYAKGFSPNPLWQQHAKSLIPSTKRNRTTIRLQTPWRRLPPKSRPTAQTAVAAHLQGEIDRLKGERDQLVDRLARLQAEFENARKREARERADFRDFAVSGAVEQFLPVLDNFQLALGSAGSLEQLRAGIELIVKQMEDVLRTLNVQPVESVGSPLRSPRA